MLTTASAERGITSHKLIVCYYNRTEYQYPCNTFGGYVSTLLMAVQRPCFSKVPKLFKCISGDIILFVSSKGRRLEAQNFAVTFVFIPFTTYGKSSYIKIKVTFI